LRGFRVLSKHLIWPKLWLSQQVGARREGTLRRGPAMSMQGVALPVVGSPSLSIAIGAAPARGAAGSI